MKNKINWITTINTDTINVQYRAINKDVVEVKIKQPKVTKTFYKKGVSLPVLENYTNKRLYESDLHDILRSIVLTGKCKKSFWVTEKGTKSFQLSKRNVYMI